MRSRLLISLSLALGFGASSASGVLAAPVTAANTVGAGAIDTQVLAITLNNEVKGNVFVGIVPGGDFLIKPADLKSMGFRDVSGQALPFEGETGISLKSMKNVTFSLDEKSLSLKITAPAEALARHAYELNPRLASDGIIPRGNSAFLNYSLNYTGPSVHGFQLSNELGVRLGDYLLTSNSDFNENAADRKVVRLMTSVTHDDRDTLQRTIFGDFITSSGNLGNGVMLGGLSFSKLYRLDPLFIRYPLQTITGKVGLPTDLEVYVGGQRISTQRLSPGEFELRNINGYPGAGNVEVVLRDAFGRVQRINYPFYYSDQPLKAGLHEYSYNAGFIRRDFGTVSNNYGELAASLFHRYGFTNRLTMGLRAEGKRGFLNAGPQMVYVMGMGGVLNLALAASRNDGQSGLAGQLGYSYQERHWNFGFSARRDTRHYAVLDDQSIALRRKFEGVAYVGYSPDGWGSVSLSRSILRAHDTETTAGPTSVFSNRRVTSLSYSLPLWHGQASLSATFSHVREQDSHKEAFVNLTWFLNNNYSASAYLQKVDAYNTEALQFAKNQPFGEGMGYRATVHRERTVGGDTYSITPSFQYNSPSAVIAGDFDRRVDPTQASSSYSVTLAGSAVYAGGALAYGRPVADSFGIVRVGQIKDVRVMVNNQEVGRTDANGELFIPTMNSYYENQVRIASNDIPIDYKLDTLALKLSPSLRSGSLIDFAPTRIQAVTGMLKLREAGKTVPLANGEITLDVDGKRMTSPSGQDGAFYLENLPAGDHAATATAGNRRCAFRLKVPQSTEMFIEVGDVVCD